MRWRGLTPTLPVKASLALLAAVVAAGLLPAAGSPQPSTHASSAFTPAPHRNPPIVPNVGTAAKPLRIVSLVPATYPNSRQLRDFGTVLSSSVWLARVTAAWHIPGPPQASLVLKVLDMPALDRHRTVGEYQDYLFQKARQAGIPKLPGYQTIYILYIPCTDSFGMDSFGCVSHHPAVDPARRLPFGVGAAPESSLFVQGDSMAVVLKEFSLDGDTSAASHELAEAATNTKGVGQWRLHTDHPDTPWLDAPPWIRSTGTIEVADLAGGTFWYEHAPTGETFRYERIHSNGASAANGDPDVPASPYPYYSVFTEKDWLPFSGANHADVSVRAWSARSLPKWKLTAEVATWKGEKAGAADPCALRNASSWMVKNGTNVDVVVTIAHPNGPAGWCTLTLTSARPQPNGDKSHFWNVGLMVGRA